MMRLAEFSWSGAGPNFVVNHHLPTADLRGTSSTTTGMIPTRQKPPTQAALSQGRPMSVERLLPRLADSRSNNLYPLATSSLFLPLTVVPAFSHLSSVFAAPLQTENGVALSSFFFFFFVTFLITVSHFIDYKLSLLHFRGAMIGRYSKVQVWCYIVIERRTMSLLPDEQLDHLIPGSVTNEQ